jgi:hypothetical protein
LDFYPAQDSQFVLSLQDEQMTSAEVGIVSLTRQTIFSAERYKFVLRMLNDEEKNFIEYWEYHRLKKRKVVKQLSVGLPLGVVIVAAIFINFFSGWDKRAQMVINTDPSVILIVIIACLLIVLFIAIFSVRHRWDLNEQRYKELLARRDED